MIKLVATLMCLAALKSTSPIPSNIAKPAFGPTARWIWDGGPEKPVDCYRLFRKTFTVPSKPGKAVLKITADAEYRLYVNGEYVGRGPAPNPPAHISFDEIDIANHLRVGQNAIGVIVYHLGIPSFPRMLGRAGLIAELNVPGRPVSTDKSWRWHDAWWEPTGEKFSPFREYTEHLDARKEPTGWTNIDFDDSMWAKAVELGPSGSAPWLQPDARDIPLPDHHPAYAKRVYGLTTTERRVPDKKQAASILTKASMGMARHEKGRPNLADLPGGTLSSILFEKSLTDPKELPHTMDAQNSPRVYCLDFGREVSGYPEIEAKSSTDGAVLDLAYGEGQDADGSVSIRRQGNPDCDRLTLRKGSQTLRIFHHRAFRYMVFALWNGIIELKAPRVIESGYPNKDRGSFSCSDNKLTKIWEVGRHTMRICMDQGFMDCPWRERGQYIGDGLAEGPVALYAFGDTTLMRRFLRQAQFCQPEDGLLEPAYPCDWTIWHGTRGPNRIPGYGLLWVVMLEQYYRNTGDVALVKELGPTLDKLMAWFEPHRDQDGLLSTIPEWNFIDWVRLSDTAGHACLNLQYLMALRSAAELNRAAGQSDHWSKEAERVAKALESAHWDEKRGLYNDDPGHFSEHTNALALLALVRDPLKAKRIIDQLDEPDLVKPESPYFEGFVLRALCKWGRQDTALKIIRDKWGRMVDEGATTFWEGFTMQTSMCHAWSCTPTALLSEEVLGVRYDAHTKTITFSPSAVDLKWVKGVAPMKCGDVSVNWELNGNNLKAEISAPRDTGTRVTAPALYVISRIDGKAAKRNATLSGGKHLIEFEGRQR